MEKFVLFAMPRTGSNWLRNILHSHPEVMCFSALFRRRPWRKNELNEVQASVDPRFYSDFKYRNANADAVFNTIFEGCPSTRYVGLKHMANGETQIRNQLAKDPQYKKLILTRKNLLAVYASNLLAKATGQGSARRHQQIKREPIYFDEKDFQKFVKNHLKKFDELREICNGDVIEVEYTALRNKGDLDRIAAFFGIDTDRMALDVTRKRGDDRIVDRFENPDDALTALQRMDREDWVDESG